MQATYQETLNFCRFLTKNFRFFELNATEAETLVALIVISKKTADQPNVRPFCFAGNKKIGDSIGRTENQVTRILNGLAKKEYIKVVRRGNGKRFPRPVAGEMHPGPSHIDLKPLFVKASLIDEKKADIKRKNEEICALKDEATDLIHRIILQAPESCPHRGPYMSDPVEMDWVKKLRPKRIKSEKTLMGAITRLKKLEQEINGPIGPPLPRKMVATGTLNGGHIKQTNTTQEDRKGETSNTAGSVFGISIEHIKLYVHGNFETLNPADPADSICKIIARNLGLNAQDLCALHDPNDDGAKIFFALLYVGHLCPINPRRYVLKLAHLQKLNKLDLETKVRHAIRCNAYRLKNNQRNQTGTELYAKWR